MSEVVLERTAPRRRPAHLWVVGILSLLWNSVGAFDYLATQLKLDFYLERFSAAQMAYFYSFPSWAVAAWALGVWGAFVGSVGLLLARGWAVWAFAISLAGLAVNTIYTFGMSDGSGVMGESAAAFSALIWAIAIALLAYAVRQRSRGVLR